MARASSNWPSTEEEFLKWFWVGSNGNDLIRKLNKVPGQQDSIRREKERPHIYGIVLNADPFPFKAGRDQWKLCKIGFTHAGTKEVDKTNRMNQVKEEVMLKYNRKKKESDPKAKASVLFVLAIGAVDTTQYRDTEGRIRKKVGKPVPKAKAKEHGLPCSTEWVLTTQKHIDLIKKKKEKKTKEVRESQGDVIDFFQDISESDTPTPPDPEAPPDQNEEKRKNNKLYMSWFGLTKE